MLNLWMMRQARNVPKVLSSVPTKSSAQAARARPLMSNGQHFCRVHNVLVYKEFNRRAIHSSAVLAKPRGSSSSNNSKTSASSSFSASKPETEAGSAGSEPKENVTGAAKSEEQAATPSSGSTPESPTLSSSESVDPLEPEDTDRMEAKAYEFPWLYDDQGSRITNYPYPKAPKVWAFLGFFPQTLQYLTCKAACMRMLRSNTSEEYFPDQFLQGAGLALHQLMPLISTSESSRDKLRNMMTQELYDVFESELEQQAQVGNKVDIRLASVHDGIIKDVWVLLGPRLESGTTPGFIRWRWQSLTVALRAATDQMTSREQVAHMMMEGVQFKVDVEFDASIDYNITSKATDEEFISDYTRRSLVVRFQTPYFRPAEQMVQSRNPNRPHEAPIDWHWRVADIDYLLEKDFVQKRIRDDVLEEAHAEREMNR